MLNLFIGLFLLCSTFGYSLFKTKTDSVIRKPRQHTEPLRLD